MILQTLKRMIRSHHRLYLTLYFLRIHLRRWRYGLKDVHPTTHIGVASSISRDLITLEYCYLGGECHIGPKVELGRYVLFAPRVAIVGADHCFDQPGVPICFSGRPTLPRTVIEDDVWIGYGATVMAGVRIGRGAVVAAGAVVTHDIPPYEIWGGVPARKIRERFADRERQIHDLMLSGPAKLGETPESRDY